MERLTYKQAYDMIIDAYFKDEIKPIDPQFCFCGTLAPDRNWQSKSKVGLWGNGYPYSREEYKSMESVLLLKIAPYKIYYNKVNNIHEFVKGQPGYEDALFDGMCAALEVLKDIHRSRGENVDGQPMLTKRNLELCHTETR